MNFKQHRLILANQLYKLPTRASLIGLCDDLFVIRDIPKRKENALAILYASILYACLS